MDFDIPDIDTVDAVHSGARPMPRSAVPAAAPSVAVPRPHGHATPSATSSFAAPTPPRPVALPVPPAATIARSLAAPASLPAAQNQRSASGLAVGAPPRGPSAQALQAFAGSSSAAAASTAATTDARSTLLVGQKQRGNPILSYIKNVRWAFADIVPDYVMGRTTCAIYLSLRFHSLHPTYLYKRIKEVRNDFKLRVVLVQVDIDDVDKSMLDVCRTAILSDFTVVCAFSPGEAARYLETYKAYENKPATSIQERVDTAYLPKVTDVLTLLSHFGSVARILTATAAELAECPGIGDKKVRRIHDTLHTSLVGKAAGKPAVVAPVETVAAVAAAPAVVAASPARPRPAVAAAVSPAGAVTFPTTAGHVHDAAPVVDAAARHDEFYDEADLMIDVFE